MMNDEAVLMQRLERLAAALERLARPAPVPADFEPAESFVWHADEERFEPVARYKVAGSDTWTQPAISGNRIFVKDVTSLTLWTIN